MRYVLTGRAPVPPTFRCDHFEIGGVNAAECSVCGLLAPSDHYVSRYEVAP